MRNGCALTLPDVVFTVATGRIVVSQELEISLFDRAELAKSSSADSLLFGAIIPIEQAGLPAIVPFGSTH